MLIIQFIIMSEDKLKKVIDKYTKKYDFTKIDFFNFVETKVDLTKKKCQKFKQIIDRLIDDKFDESELPKLLRLIAAFQSECDITNIQDQDLRQYSKIRFKDNNKNSQTLQKSLDSQPTKKNQQKRKKSNNKQPKEQPKEQTQKSQTSSDKILNQPEKSYYTKQIEQVKIVEKIQKPKGKQVEIIDDDDDQQPVVHVKKQNKIDKKDSKNTKNDVKPQEQMDKSEIVISQQNQHQDNVDDWQRQVQQNRRRQFQRMLQQERIQNQRKHQEKKKEKEKINQVIPRQIQKKSSAERRKQECQIQRLKTIEQQRTQQINTCSRNSNNQKNSQQQNSKQKDINQILQMVECDPGKQVISINKFEKTGQDFMNPVIKYQIVYKQKYVTWRRYSEIEKLLAYLRYKYEGIVLPEMPPKQGIKGNLTYFWRSGVNENFLQERKQKLKLVLNRVLACQYVSQDQTLQRFLQDEQFQLPNANNQQSGSYLQTLVGLKDIAFNYNELKDYGVAYYNYITEYKNKTIDTECSKEYQKLQNIISSILIINQHRLLINANFQKRRQIMYASNIKTKGPIKTNLDKILQEAEIQCRELNQQYGRYLQLKSTEGWENLLIKQKSTQGGKALEKVKEDHSKTVQRIVKAESNLLKSMKKFGQKNQKLLQNLAKEVLDWRRKAHP